MSHQRGKPYPTLQQEVERHGDWPTLRLITGKSTEKLASVMEDLCLDAARHNDDKTAKHYLDWLFKAIEAIHLLPLLDPETQVLGFGKEVDAAKEAVRKHRVEKAMELWPQLPTEKDGTALEWIAQDENRLIKVPVASLPETKQALLTKIAERWRETKEEEEADRLFDFLQTLKAKFEEEKKMMESVLREATRSGFPPPRMARYYLKLGDPNGRWSVERPRDELARLLGIGWIRNSQPKERERIIRAVAPIMECSDEAFDAVEAYAERIAALEGRLASLKEALGIARDRWMTSRRNVAFQYWDKDYIVVTEFMSTDTYNKFDENEMHDKFTELREILAGWLIDNADLSVLVRLVVPNRYDNKKTLFEREQKLR